MGYNSYDPAKSRKKKKKTGIIVCSVILAVVVAAAVGGFVLYNNNKGNIEALKYASDYTSDEIQQKIANNNDETRKKVIEITGTEMRDLTEEETEMLETGQITEDEAAALVVGETTLDEILDGTFEAEQSSGNAQEAEQSAESSENAVSDATGENVSTSSNSSGEAASGSKPSTPQSDVSATVSKIYVLKSEFTSSVESLISQAKADHAAGMSTPDLMRKYSGLAASLESSCDSRMESLLSELDASLDASGGDKSVINEIRSSYENEKSLKKAELLSKYKK